MNCVPYFQSNMELLFAHLNDITSLDDILWNAESNERLLDTLGNVLRSCAIKGLKRNPNKCDLVLKEANFCGRIIDAKGINSNPRNYNAVVRMPTPKTVGPLMELVHRDNWVRSAISSFSELIKPLHNLLDQKHRLHNSRKK